MNSRYPLLIALLVLASSRVEASFLDDLTSAVEEATRIPAPEGDYGINGRDGCVIPSPAPSEPRIPQLAEQTSDAGSVCVTMLGRVDIPSGLPVGSACWISTQFGPVSGAVVR